MQDYKNLNSTYLLAFMILAIYLAPIIALSVYCIYLSQSYAAWRILFCGLFLASFGSLLLFVLLRDSIAIINCFAVVKGLFSPDFASVTKTSLASAPKLVDDKNRSQLKTSEKRLVIQTQLMEAYEQQERLQNDLDAKNEELNKMVIEYEILERNRLRILQEHDKCKNIITENENAHQQITQEYQQTINSLKSDLAKQQQHCSSLENKVQESTSVIRDLEYEIKTLLAVNAEPSNNETHWHSNISNDSSNMIVNAYPHPTDTPGNALLFLSNCVEVAKKLIPSQHIHGNMGGSLDLRRLADCLPSDPSVIMFLYSSKEDKFLFISDNVQDIFGWSPDKFIAFFSSIAKESENEWKQLTSSLAFKDDISARLVLNTKNNVDLLVNCRLMKIPSGAFRLLHFGIFYLYV